MNQQMPKINVDIEQLQTLACAHCQSPFFEPAVIYKVVPAIYSQSGKADLLGIGAIKCINCDTVYALTDILKQLSIGGSPNEQLI